MKALRLSRKNKTDISLWSMLRWSYLKQQVIAETGRGLEDVESFLAGEFRDCRVTTDGTVSMERLSVVGTFVDGRPADALAARVHPDAALLHELVCMLPRHLGRSLVSAVLSDTVPTSYAGPVEWRAVEPRDHGQRLGKPKDGARYEVDGNWAVCPRPRVCNVRDGKPLPKERTVRQGVWLYELYDDCALVFSPFCPVVQEPDQGAIERRAQHAREFRAAMDDLFEMVCGTSFERYSVIGSGL